MATSFQHAPWQPSSPLCQKGFVILSNAHDAASSFLAVFEAIRRERRAKGTPTDEEQNLLRAMLVFASAGLDSLAKQLVQDALPSVLGRSEGAGKMFKVFVERRLRAADGIDIKVLADVLGDSQPRQRLTELYIHDLTSGSLQSTEELLRVGAAFDIPSVSLAANTSALTEVFRVRNQIVHEMDVDFDQPNRNRTPRAKQTMIEHTNRVFEVAKAFLEGVDSQLSA